MVRDALSVQTERVNSVVRGRECPISCDWDGGVSSECVVMVEVVQAACCVLRISVVWCAVSVVVSAVACYRHVS